MSKIDFVLPQSTENEMMLAENLSEELYELTLVSDKNTDFICIVF